MVATLVGISVCSSLSVYGLTSTLGLDISCLERIRRRFSALALAIILLLA